MLPGTIPIPTKRPDCFPPGTPITLADGGTRPIEEIAVGDRVLSFETSPQRAGGTLVGGRVVRLFENITTEFIVLTVRRADGYSEELTVTPGHSFFTVDGHFRTIGALLGEGNGTARVVLEDGFVATATGVHIRYGAETASLFEQAEELVGVVDGALALKPDVLRGWRTCNFEVEDFHTYIAGGVRVHNDSEPGPKYPTAPLDRPVDTGVGSKTITGVAPAVRDPASIDAMAPKVVVPVPTPRPSQLSDIRIAPPVPDAMTDQPTGRRMFDPQPGVQERMDGFGPPTTLMPDVMPQLRQTYAPHPVRGNVSQPMPGVAPQPMNFAPSPYGSAPQPLPDRRAAAENALRQALAERALTAPMPTPSPLQQALMDRILLR